MTVSLIVFTFIFGGALLGLFLRRFLPGHHLSKESKELVFNIVVGLMAVMAALVLGLLIAAAQDSFREERSDIMKLSARIIFLDRVLAHYGPDTKEVRELLHSAVERAVSQMWLHENPKSAQLEATPSNLEVLIEKIQELAPKNETQRALRDQALSLVLDLVQTRWLLFVEQVKAIPVAFLIVLALLVFWFTTIFFGFGLFAPSNLTVVTILFVSTVWVSSAFFLLIELNRPFEGLIHIPREPMRETLQQLGK